MQISRALGLRSGTDVRTLQQIQRQMGDVQEQIASGKRVVRASDDPVAFSRAQRLGVLDRRYEQYERNMETAQGWLDHAQRTVDEITELFQTAHEKGMLATNLPLIEDAERVMLGDDVERLVDELVTKLNTRKGEDFLFGDRGAETRPFNRAADVVSYAGGTDVPTQRIGDGVEIEVTLTGNDLLVTPQGTNIAAELGALRDAIRADDPVALREGLGRVAAARDHLISLGAELGSRSSRMNVAGEQLGEARFTVGSHIAEAEDTDLLEAISALKTLETRQQAALKATASISQLSLLDYL